MMSFIITLFLYFIAGWSLLVMGNIKRSASEMLGLAIFLGMGFFHFFSQLFLVLSSPLSIWFYLGPLLVLLLVFFALKKGHHLSEYSSFFVPPKNFLRSEYFFLFIILIQVGHVLIMSAWKPVVLNDDWHHYLGHTKFLYFNQFIDEKYFRQLMLANYPLFHVTQESLYALIAGGIDEYWGNNFLILYFISFLLITYSFLTELASRKFALVITAIITLIPYFIKISFDGTADIPLAISLTLLAIYLLKYSHSSSKSDLIFACLFLGISWSLKLEGFYSGIASLLSFILIYRKNLSSKKLFLCSTLVTTTLLFFLPWKIKTSFYPSSYSRWETYQGFSWMISPDTYITLANYFLEILLPSKNYAILGLFFIGALGYFILKNRHHRPSLFLIISSLLISGIYIGGSFMTACGPQIPRLVGHTTGLIVLFICFQILHFNKRSES